MKIKEMVNCGILFVLTVLSGCVMAEDKIVSSRLIFKHPLDSLPIREKTVLEMTSEAKEGYIVKRDAGHKALIVKFKTMEPVDQAKEDCNTDGLKCSIIKGVNVTNLKYSLDSMVKKEGSGSLKISFRKGHISYCGGVFIKAFLPGLDARGAKINVWIRSNTSAGRGIHIYFLDKVDRTCESWSFYGKKVTNGNWQRLEITQGQKSGAVKHVATSKYQGDIKNVHSIKISVFGYSVKTPASYNIDAIELIPAKHIYFESAMKLEGLCSLRSEGKIDGLGARWFDPQLDDTNWKKAPIVKFWSKSNNPIAWYRIPFKLSKETIDKIKAKSVFIVFGGVDESAWVWLNGEKIGAHSENSKAGWNQPFAFDVTGKLKLDAENLLAVKVLNRESAGGIWGPVLIVTEKEIKL